MVGRGVAVGVGVWVGTSVAVAVGCGVLVGVGVADKPQADRAILKINVTDNIDLTFAIPIIFSLYQI